MGHDSGYQALESAARAGRLSRRQVLQRAAALGLTAPAIAGLLVACRGGGERAMTPAATAVDAGEQTPTTERDDAEPSPDATSTVDAATPEPRGGGGTLRLLYWQAPTILNPHLAQGEKDIHAARICLQPLADFAADGAMVPVLAAEEPTLANGLLAEDGLSVTWRLREDVIWHDGEPFTANDVRFTFDYIADEATRSPSASLYDAVETVDIIDPYTVRVYFKQPEPAWSMVFTGSHGMILPEHLLRDDVGQQARDAEFNLMPIGTGPYRVSAFTPGELVVYELFDDYWEPGKPYFDAVELKGGGDPETAARAVLEDDDADWAWNIQVEEAVLAELEAAGTGRVVTWPGGGTETLQINFADPYIEQDGQRSHKDVPHPHFREKAVRQAVALAVDRDAIATQLYGRAGVPAASTINTPTNLIPGDISWAFDLDRAAALLDEVGATPGPDAMRVLHGREMRWLFQTSITSIRQKTQEMITSALQSIGIAVDLKTIDASVYFSSAPEYEDAANHFYADLQMYTSSPKHIFPLDWYRRYLSTAIAQRENGWAEPNYARYQNPEFDALFDAVAGEPDPARATTLFQDMQRLVWEDVAEIAIIARQHVSCASSRLTGYSLSAWRPEVADIADWRSRDE